MELTKKQLELVTQYIDLPKYVVYKKFTSRDFSLTDDMISVGNEGLLIAAKTFDESIGKPFNLYAICIIGRHIVRYLKWERVRRKHYVDLDSPAMLYEESLRVEIDNAEEEQYNKYLIEKATKVVNSMRPIWRTVFWQYIYGSSIKDIAKKNNMTHQNVYRILGIIKEKINIKNLDKQY